MQKQKQIRSQGCFKENKQHRKIQFMDRLKQLLVEVQNGKHSFKPDAESNESLELFQSTAKTLIHAHKKGYLDECKIMRESVTGNGWYAVVVIRGGLTYEGEQLLSTEQIVESNSKEANSIHEDIIELKPSFYGIVINLNAIWRRIKRR